MAFIVILFYGHSLYIYIYTHTHIKIKKKKLGE